MKQQDEKPQQINDLEVSISSVRDASGMNDARTGAKSDTPLTRAVSLSVLISQLAGRRQGHPKADIVSTLIEQCKYYDRTGAVVMRPKILATIERISPLNAENPRDFSRGFPPS